MSDLPARVRTTIDGHVISIGLDRADKLNAFDLQMLRELSEAYTRYEDDPSLRCAVLYANGRAFTAGLDLAEVGPAVASGEPMFPADLVNPLGLSGRQRTKPLVMAVHGWCLTIGIELMLASDIRVASRDARFGQIEVNRGIFPFGGATVRWPAISGWGNAMRYLLTGDRFDAETAYRIGLVQELCEPGEQLSTARALAQRIAQRAPLGIQATLTSASTAREHGQARALAELQGQAIALFDTEDAKEGMRSFVERREGRFTGR